MYGANIRTSLASWFYGHGRHKSMMSPNGNVEFVNQRARSYRPVLLMGVSRSLECGWPSTILAHPHIVRLRSTAFPPRTAARTARRLRDREQRSLHVELMRLGEL